MNREENRLRTFTTWPPNANVDPRNLARNGFSATGRFLEAECNWCHCRMSMSECQHEYVNQMRDRHFQSCPFLDNYENCGNVPLIVNIPTSTQSADLLVEANRLATFNNWPNPNISPASLAKAGFFYLNRSDEVKCAWCKGVIAKWEKQDNAFEEHRRLFPDCPRVQLGPLIDMAGDGFRDLGIQQISAPKKPKFSSLDARLRTYTNWPIGDVQQPNALAQAGLYYQDVDDQVRCFHCNIGLRSWQKEDDPWFEHAKWHPQCQFVRLVKGAQYVQQVHDLTRSSAQQGLNDPNPIGPSVSIEEAMTTPAVLQALEIGIDGGSIRNATQRQLVTCGRPYDTVEDLVKAVFGDRDDENATSSNEGSGSIVREVSRIITSIFGTAEEGHNIAPHSSVGLEPPASASSRNIYSAPTSLSAESATDLHLQKKPSSIGESEQTNSEDLEISPLRKLSSSANLSLEEENRMLKDARLCKVCLDEEVGVVFLPCGHLVTCVQCAPGVNQCPMCRSGIKGFVRTYLS